MKLLTTTTEYTETINIAVNLQGEYSKSVTFHCYWSGVAGTTRKHRFWIDAAV